MIILLLNQGLKNFTTINMEHKITLSYSEQQEVELFCKLNNITIDELIKKSFKTGYNIEKYGLVGNMGGIQEKWVEKEVIREKRVEIPVEVIKEVEKIVEVIKEVPVDRVVIKEVPVETVVTKIEYISDKTSENELLSKRQARMPIQWLAVCVFPDPRPASIRKVSYSPSSGSLWCAKACKCHRTCQMAASSCCLGQCLLFCANFFNISSCLSVNGMK